MKLSHRTLTTFVLGMAAFNVALAAPADDAVSTLQQRWEQVKYGAPAGGQERAFEALSAEADTVLSRYPDSAGVLIWHGIVVASHAGAKGGLGALGLAKTAKKDAYTSLGSLYYQVPGWPIGFGDKDKAREYLQQGLALNPDGIDANYFLGDFLYRQGDFAGAERCLRKALQAPARPGRKLADSGRRAEAEALLAQVAAKRK
ncbi:MAG: tetratricopeptide repeat protein [Oxalobacteraceae bacterium]|nr:MAG: tetratricopeptide repeat protein [Oxalobacteraceae bacterium]